MTTVVKRSKDKGKNGKLLSAITIRKELSTFRTVWTWAISMKYVSRPFPNQNLRFPKTTDKPPFQTRTEIERRVALGGLTDAELHDLWDGLFLRIAEIDEVLDHLKQHSEYDFLYPMTRQDEDAVTVDEATYHLSKTLSGSKWKDIRGWHIFRHSFISNCAAKGIDQRMIDRWSGHQTDEMRKRYTHLFPDAQQEAISMVFGD